MVDADDRTVVLEGDSASRILKQRVQRIGVDHLVQRRFEVAKLDPGFGPDRRDDRQTRQGFGGLSCRNIDLLFIAFAILVHASLTPSAYIHIDPKYFDSIYTMTTE